MTQDHSQQNLPPQSPVEPVSPVYPRTEADAIAEQKLDQIPQERFDQFGPGDYAIKHPFEGPAVTRAKRFGTIIGHAVELGTGGRGAQSAESRKIRDEERERVGLPPKYSA